MIATTYGYVYVAQIAMGADHAQTLKAIREAEAWHGPSIIIAYAPCINHGLKAKGGMGKSQAEEKKAVECGSTLRSLTGRTSTTSCSVRFVTSLLRRLILTRLRNCLPRPRRWLRSATRLTSARLPRIGATSNPLLYNIKRGETATVSPLFHFIHFVTSSYSAQSCILWSGWPLG